MLYLVAVAIISFYGIEINDIVYIIIVILIF